MDRNEAKLLKVGDRIMFRLAGQTRAPGLNELGTVIEKYAISFRVRYDDGATRAYALSAAGNLHHLRHVSADPRQAYTIRIDEPQRAVLIKFLTRGRDERPGEYLNVGSPTDDDFASVDELIAMLANLPAEEAAVPNALHGFCL